MTDSERIGPDPNCSYPLRYYGRLCFLKNVVKNPNIIVGDYTYYDDFENPENFEKNVRYHFDFVGDKLIIGKFCAIASDVTFIMNGGNHSLENFTTYPFWIFGEGWEKMTPSSDNSRGDTIIENDVWIGYKATIMPGVRIGNGAVVATHAIVTRDVEPYTIVGGNPAQPIRKRFGDDVIEILQTLRWWDWEIEKITENLEILCGDNLEKLKQLQS
ncbi:CatB-related O-acetyltransferase [Lyngbya sp. CCY1209]|uniref:CatB-related O-acetyltransferase n=1 Tax=Lyngbya sp. CCY1209 TaxID=2886103 RepID=UPI002D2092B3|nr:CatB-related O-acetyltransferase [Lyngbya sp. CCY1209]MEB3881996.1 CatB-related O-acetyltransferase [Lyngbya sp. CCY1209]